MTSQNFIDHSYLQRHTLHGVNETFSMTGTRPAAALQIHRVLKRHETLNRKWWTSLSACCLGLSRTLSDISSSLTSCSTELKPFVHTEIRQSWTDFMSLTYFTDKDVNPDFRTSSPSNREVTACPRASVCCWRSVCELVPRVISYPHTCFK